MKTPTINGQFVLVHKHREYNPENSSLSVYSLYVGKRRIGTVKKYENYLWSASLTEEARNGKLDMINDSRTLKIAVNRLFEAYKERQEA